MDIRILPRKLSGSVTPPPSKSMAHRVVLAQMLSVHPGAIANPGTSQDIQATERCVNALTSARPGTLPLLDCGESGSTLRFLIPIALAVAGGGRFTGRGRLMERPQTPYFDLFDEKGIRYELADGVLTVEGQLAPGTYTLPGNVSSQFVTGLLYALPLLPGDSEIRMTTPLESRGYVDMTLDVLNQFGIQVENRNYETFLVPGNQAYQGRDVTLESDWSQAGFWYAAGFLDNLVNIQGLNHQSSQGDMVIARLYWTLARPGNTDIDISGCPDLLPPLAVMAAVRQGTTRFTNAARLRLKESDRLTTTAALVNALGGQAEELPEELIVHGQESLSGGTVDGANDHRIVMAAGIAATACSAPVTILGAEAVNKSYPGFWDDYRTLGGDVHVL
ncbi:MAG: 3-phosphoshikimate 1-carboxyvinyltransferase [Oscillibacter sp.]|nr:3-phosphoshikimate 1-carboxyvinyltransferase [Oscillibacter sp.]